MVTNGYSVIRRESAKKKSSVTESESQSPSTLRSGRGMRPVLNSSAVRDAMRRFEQPAPTASTAAIRIPTPNVRIMSGSTVRLNEADAASVSALSVSVPAGDASAESEDSNELPSNNADGDSSSNEANLSLSAALPDATRDTLWIADLDCKYGL